MNIGIIILAAGNSSRLARPKQLLEYKGKTLLEMVTQAAMQTNCETVVTVLGAYAEEILKSHQHPAVTYVINDSWQEGISSSIAAGLLEILRQTPDIDDVIITVSDQAFISSEILKSLLLKKQLTGKNIVASHYAKTTGTPALFNRKYFDELLALKGNVGAKYIFQQHPEDIATIAFELGYIDIDTEKDYKNLIKHI